MAVLQLDAASKAEIRAGVLAGNVVTAHEKPINFNGWIGEGYTIVDPQTGAGAYKIAGGGNGTTMDFDVSIQDLFGAAFTIMSFLFGLGEFEQVLESMKTVYRVLSKVFSYLGASLGALTRLISIIDKCRNSSHIYEFVTYFVLITMVSLVSFTAKGVGPLGFIVGQMINSLFTGVLNYLFNQKVEEYCKN